MYLKITYTNIYTSSKGNNDGPYSEMILEEPLKGELKTFGTSKKSKFKILQILKNCQKYRY